MNELRTEYAIQFGDADGETGETWDWSCGCPRTFDSQHAAISECVWLRKRGQEGDDPREANCHVVQRQISDWEPLP